MPTDSQPPKFFSLHGKYGACRPVGEFTLDDVVNVIDDAIRFCFENEIGGLVVNVQRTTGFPSPSLTDRFWFVTKWAATGHGRVVLSMVAPPFMILPDKMGVTFAENRGLHSDVFMNESDAVEWLCSAY